MKRIAYLIPMFPIASETFISTEIKAIQRQGHDVVPICLQRSDQLCQAGDESLQARFLSVSDVRTVQALQQLILLFFRFFLSLFNGLSYIQSLAKAVKFVRQQRGVRTRSLWLQALKVSYLLDRHQCQHLHCHFAWSPVTNGIVAARLLGMSVSFTCHGSDVYKTPQDLQIKLQSADAVVAVCKRMQKEFMALAPDTPIEMIPCGIDTEAFVPFKHHALTSAADEHQAKNSRWLFIGRLSETKGVDYLLSALGRIERSQCPRVDIAGSGPLEQRLQQQHAALSLEEKATFIGAVNRQWLINNLNRYQAVVLPFCQTADGIMDTGPLVLKEAMACQVPILTTDLMASGEILDTSSAWICRHNDVEDLAQTMLELAEHLKAQSPSLRCASLRLRTQRAYQQVQTRFSAQRSAERLSRLFQSMPMDYANSGSLIGGGSHGNSIR